MHEECVGHKSIWAVRGTKASPRKWHLRWDLKNQSDTGRVRKKTWWAAFVCFRGTDWESKEWGREPGEEQQEGREELGRMRPSQLTGGSWVEGRGNRIWSLKEWCNPACGFWRFSWLLSKERVAESKHWIGRAAVAVKDGRAPQRLRQKRPRGE